MIRRRENDRARHVVVLVVGYVVAVSSVWSSSAHLFWHREQHWYVDVGFVDVVVMSTPFEVHFVG